MKRTFKYIRNQLMSLMLYIRQICTFTNLKIAEEFTQNAASWGKNDIF